MTSGNPFDYQRPLSGRADLIDRGAELDILQRAAADRVAIRLASPRRYGKTSLLRAYLETMAGAGHHVCFVDFDRVATLADVANRLATGVRALPADAARTIDQRLARLGISMGTAGLQVQVAPRGSTAPPTTDQARATIADLLALVGQSAGGGQLTIVAMDEFQDLLTADPHVDGLFRSAIQHQSDVAYVFAGSSPAMMRVLFDERERPFYGQARPLELGRLPENEALDHLLARLPRLPGAVQAAAELVRFADGHPQRTMLLAHHLYDMLDRPRPSPQLVDDVIAVALAELDDLFGAAWSSLDRSERATVTTLADGLSPSSQRAASQHAISRSTLRTTAGRLSDDGQLVARRGRSFVLLDPLFAEWLRRR